MASDTVGSAVLVHGLWGNPDDWYLVKPILEGKRVQVTAPDLPSHRSPVARAKEDAIEVRRAIAGSRGPVVLVGWSYGGCVISTAGDGPDVHRLIYVSDIPAPAGTDDNFVWAESDPYITFNTDGTLLLHNDPWLDRGAGTTFPAEVCDHLRRHPRRPASTGCGDPQEGAAWKTVPTTVIVGARDSFFTEQDRRKATEDFDDVQVVDSDHFIIWRQPELVADAVLRALRRQ